MGERKTYTLITETPLGKIQAAAMDNALIGLWFIGQKYFPVDAKLWLKEPDYPVFVSLKTWLNDYFASKNPKIKINLALSGTDFQQQVWKLLREIPYGKMSTYGAIAAKLSSGGKKASAQAVGGAVGHNPISILIPCHRVIGSDGSLTGYAGGLDKKRALLELEKAISTNDPGKCLPR